MRPERADHDKRREQGIGQREKSRAHDLGKGRQSARSVRREPTQDVECAGDYCNSAGQREKPAGRQIQKVAHKIRHGELDASGSRRIRRTILRKKPGHHCSDETKPAQGDSSANVVAPGAAVEVSVHALIAFQHGPLRVSCRRQTNDCSLGPARRFDQSGTGLREPSEQKGQSVALLRSAQARRTSASPAAAGIA